ncbi:MAG: glycosyltransferase family 9 protein [Candidatus Omnitrophica bacterium]|nr:glycosyltransferase family 9 protein [Candidatus Omnitrophota bacterium]
MNQRTIKNILIIGHSNIGDVCYDLTVINPLRSHFPQAKISFLTSPRSGNIVEGYKGLDRVLTFYKDTGNRGLSGRLRFMIFLAKERFDLVIVLKNTLMHKFLGIPCVWSLRKYLGCAPSEKKMHIVDIYLEFLRSHGIATHKAIFDFTLSQEDQGFCDTFFAKEKISAKDRIVGILPMAAWSLKNWPIDKWNELAELLRNQYGIKVIAFGKFSDDFYSQMILNRISHKIVLAENTTLKQAMGIIKSCNLFIGADSSLLHLASCMGVNAIGLYGATSTRYIYPYFHRHNVITSKAKIDCMPCYPGHNPCHRKTESHVGACMDGIDIEDVLRLVKQNFGL